MGIASAAVVRAFVVGLSVVLLLTLSAQASDSAPTRQKRLFVVDPQGSDGAGDGSRATPVADAREGMSVRPRRRREHHPSPSRNVHGVTLLLASVQDESAWQRAQGNHDQGQRRPTRSSRELSAERECADDLRAAPRRAATNSRHAWDGRSERLRPHHPRRAERELQRVGIVWRSASPEVRSELRSRPTRRSETAR